jgi:hypothetical protein
MDGRSEEFALQAFRSHLQVIFTCRKILSGASGFTSHSKERAQRILSPLKIHCLGKVSTRDSWVQWQAH